jgi:hypothetical protein
MPPRRYGGWGFAPICHENDAWEFAVAARTEKAPL